MWIRSERSVVLSREGTADREGASHPVPAKAQWPRRYASRLFLSDLLVVAVALVAYGMISLPNLLGPVDWPGQPGVPYWAALATVAALWLTALDVVDTRNEHVVGHGVVEYQRIVRASASVFMVVVATAFFLQINLARSVFFVAIPIGTVGLLLSRWTWRQWLRRQQRRGHFLHRAVVLGERAKTSHVIRTIRSTDGTGYLVVGAITKHGTPDPINGDVAVIGTYEDAADAAQHARADTLIYAGADDVRPHELRELGWAMADRDVDWVVAPALTDVAGPRIHARPVAGLPLIHISYPTMTGSRRFTKRLFDIVGASVLILIGAPVMAAVAIAIKLDSPGALFYRQERVGRRGKSFGMIKFRSMVADADDRLASLLDVQGTTTEPLFKVTNDPRITKVGRFLRKHSLDELPQLFNVFLGQMSLVGPRPQRPAEVALYDDAAHRRLLVKPGMSGLWQVSGRSSLSWEDALRLDLYYVENWSVTQDILILFRTVRAVVAPGDTAH